MPNEPTVKLDAIRAEKLIGLAYIRFSADVSDAEKKLLRDAASSTDPTADPRFSPKISAALLRWLVIDPQASECVDPRGVRLGCMTVLGDLTLAKDI